MTHESPPPVDPEIATFVQRLVAETVKYPRRDLIPIAEARRNAEIVRQPWAAGGPVMATTEERTIPGPGGAAMRVRIHRPTADAPLPAMLYLHGGGWTIFSLDSHDRLMREYAARAGVAVVGLDYSLSPEARFPLAVQESAAALRWLAREGGAIGIDGSRVAVGGDSAGANLSVAAALALRDAGGPVPAAMVLNYGVYDADMLTHSMVRYGGGEYLLSAHLMMWFLANYMRDAGDRRNPLLAPLHARLEGLPPAFMAIAELDVLHDENVAMANRLRAAGVAVEATVYPGTVHGFLEAVSIARVADRAFADTALWLRNILA
ncbi:MAG: alpha/beta hydrolase [Alphaproteobacteria bacterium]